MTFQGWLDNLNDPTTLDMEHQELDGLEIRPGTDTFHCFYDVEGHRLIKDFLLDDRERVALYCGVRLIAHGDTYSPRIRLWKRDKSKRAIQDWETGKMRGSHVIKALVDTDGGHENFMRLMAYLVNLATIEVDGSAFRVVEAGDAELAAALKERSRADILPIIQSALETPLTEKEIAALAGRKQHLAEFERLLHDPDYMQQRVASGGGGVESVWQRFFEDASWIFGYGLDLVSHAALDEGKLERITVGNNVWTGAGKRSDAIMRTRARISTLLFCEIKRHDTELLKAAAYRPPDVYAPSDELVGGTAQLQKTVRKAFRYMIKQIEGKTAPDGSPTGLDFSTTRPRQVLVIGSLAEFRTDAGVNGEQMESFELYRKSHNEVEVITFDELYERARFIIEG